MIFRMLYKRESKLVGTTFTASDSNLAGIFAEIYVKRLARYEPRAGIRLVSVIQVSGPHKLGNPERCLKQGSLL
jgi:hypothetical protein